jgi:DNA-binding CsgD family transcriptional regulator
MSLPTELSFERENADSVHAADPGNPFLLAQLRKADLLYQVDALEAAAECLLDIATSDPDGDTKTIVLARLARIERDLGHTEIARQRLANALDCAEHSIQALTENAQGELLAARAWVAVSDANAGEMETLTAQLSLLAMSSTKGDRLWSLVAWTSAYVSIYKFSRQDVKGALASYKKAAAALAYTADAPPVVRVTLLALCAALDMHDPERVHLANAENEAAYALALEHGMVGSACDALHNSLIFSVYCDELEQSTNNKSFAHNVIEDPIVRSICANDAMLAATAAATFGRFDAAVKFIEQGRGNYSGEVFTWTPAFCVPVFTTLEARVLHKASRFVAAERVAAKAVKDWERAGLGSGAALRIQAEAFEALGCRSAALATILDALDALESFSPVHHLLGAYSCAYRLTNSHSFLEPLDYLKHAVRQVSPTIAVSAAVATQPTNRRIGQTLTPRERDVALLVASGSTNPEIARNLGISRKTVANHVATIFERLGLRARWQLTHDLIQEKRF